MEYTIVQNNIVVNVIEADEAFILTNHDDDIVVEGRFPTGYLFVDGHFIPSTKLAANDIVATSAYTNQLVRIITSRAFKKRLTVAERDAIRASTDPYIKDIWFDLNDSGYVDLDDDDLALGIAYVTNYLTTIPSFQNANVMTVINPSTRLTELLINGDEFEKYNGVL